MLNYIWAGFFLIALVYSLAEWLIFGHAGIFETMVHALFSNAELGFHIALGLTGTMALWLGFMRIGERAGIIDFMTRCIKPFFSRIFPQVPEEHPAVGSMCLNMAANLFGLDNAATPMGLRAMRELQDLNPSKEEASNAQILFIVLNASAVTLFPISIFAYRAQMGAQDPADVFVPILISTYFSALTGLVSVSVVQRLPFFNRVVLGWIGGLTVFVLLVAAYFSELPPGSLVYQSSLLSNFMLLGLVGLFLSFGLIKRINVFDVFIEGAKEGFQITVVLIPYLVAMLVAVGILQSSGLLDAVLTIIRHAVALTGLDTRFVDALPTALMKPLSGSGARALMIEAMHRYGPDSLVGRMVCIIQGSTETTFYVIAVYFGSVGIRHTRHAISCALLAEFAGVVSAILVSYWFYG